MTAAREAAGVSQRELADRLGRDKRTIQKWEKGEMKIALEDFLAVFDALKVQVEPYSKWIRHPELFLNGLSDILQYSTDKSAWHWGFLQPPGVAHGGRAGILLSVC